MIYELLTPGPRMVGGNREGSTFQRGWLSSRICHRTIILRPPRDPGGLATPNYCHPCIQRHGGAFWCCSGVGACISEHMLNAFRLDDHSHVASGELHSTIVVPRNSHMTIIIRYRAPGSPISISISRFEGPLGREGGTVRSARLLSYCDIPGHPWEKRHHEDITIRQHSEIPGDRS